MRSKMKTASLREIKGSFGRYFAILAIIALGVGFFSGVRITTPAMIRNMDEFYSEHQLFDYRLVSTIGWDAKDVQMLAAQPDVRACEGAVSADLLCTEETGSKEFVIKAHSITENVNTLQLAQGRMPQKANECVLDAKMGGMKTNGSGSAAMIKVKSENDADTLDTLKYTEFTVVGYVHSPLYANFERGTTSLGTGSIDGFMYVMPEAFDTDYFTEIYVRFDQDEKIYSDEYKDYMEARKKTWEMLARTRADARFDSIYGEAYIEISDGKDELEEKREDGQKELDDARNELDDARKKLSDADKELSDAKKEIDDGDEKLKDSKKKLSDAKKEIDENEKKLADAKDEFDRAKETLDNTKRTLDETGERLNEAQQQIESARAQIDAAEAELLARENEFAVSERELAAAEQAFIEQYGQYLDILDRLPEEQRAAIIAARSQLEQSRAQLEAARTQLSSARTQFDAQRSEFNSQKAQYEIGREQYENGVAQYNKGLEEYQSRLEEYEKGVKELEKGKAEYEKALKEYSKGEKELDKGKKEYEDGLKEYSDGRADYEDGLKEYNDGEREFDEKIADAERKISEAEDELEELKAPETFVLGRGTNIGYACFENDSQIVAQVARVFPVFFILVAALVCMTTMSRMVEEQRTQIGVFKALGYSNGTIMGKLMFYSGSAAVIGAVLGYAVGTVLFPRVIWMTYQLMYIPLEMKYLFDVQLAVISGAVSLICSLGTTWVSCRYELSETAASLMRPKAPKAGKRVLLERIPFIWKRMKFLHKVSIRNIFRYKKRLFMMIVGISGCTALLLTGFGLKDSVAGFADVQYGEIFVTDADMTFTPKNGTIPEKLKTRVEENTREYKLIRECSFDLITEDATKAMTVIVPESFDGMDSFVKLRDAEGTPVSPPGAGQAIVSQSVEERYNVHKGDRIRLRDENMHEIEAVVSGVFENHVYNYVFLSAETFEEQSGDPPEFNGAFMNFEDGADGHKTAAVIAKSKSVKSITLYSELMDRMSKTMSSLNYVVLLVIVSAAGLAFIVLYNLTNINITERIREIATIKVLGFFRGETSAYVLRENIALTAFGTAVGLGLGILLHRFVMQQIVVDLVSFRVRILPLSYVYSIVLTFVFTFLVDLVMETKLERINMAESLKSVD
ncbi:MAG: FtsX-like permease family protein [Ruminococcus sp.]|nr:FtsX-like permease family protein [Ruminococcus sp.]